MDTRTALQGSSILWLSVAALVIVGVLASRQLRLEEPVDVMDPSAQEVSVAGDALAAGVGQGGGMGQRLEAAASPTNTSVGSPCGYFLPWKDIDSSPENVIAFLESAEDLSRLDLSCVNSEWLVLALFMHCDGAHTLSSADAELIASALSGGLPDPVSLSKSSIVEHISPMALQCFLTGILPFGASEEEIGKAWAWGLMALFGDKGSLFSADPEVVAALLSLMGHWPLESDRWWAHLWAGFPQYDGMNSVKLRVAIYEALHQTLSEGDWLQRLSLLAEFEGNGTNGSFSLWALGNTLGQHISSDDFIALLSMHDSPEWIRALVFSFPQGSRWPATGSLLVPDYAKEILMELRDSGDYLYLGELLINQWALLGPQEALADLEGYIYDNPRTGDYWGFQAAVRVMAAVTAAQVTSPLEGDAAFLAGGEAMIRELFFSASPAETKKILGALRSYQLIPTETRSAWRDKFVEVLGQAWLMGLSASDREWLEGM